MTTTRCEFDDDVNTVSSPESLLRIYHLVAAALAAPQSVGNASGVPQLLKEALEEMATSSWGYRLKTSLMP